MTKSARTLRREARRHNQRIRGDPLRAVDAQGLLPSPDLGWRLQAPA